MKKIYILMLSALISFAEVPKEKRFAFEMKLLLDAMEEIQKGGLYNCTECMEKGVKKLKENLSSIKSVEVKSFLPEHQKYAYKFAQKRAKMIEMYADDMLESIKNNRPEEALNDYAQILKQCMSCHMRLREW